MVVPAGANFEFEWYHDNRGDEIIAAVSTPSIHHTLRIPEHLLTNKQSHKGPVQGMLFAKSIAIYADQ